MAARTTSAHKRNVVPCSTRCGSLGLAQVDPVGRPPLMDRGVVECTVNQNALRHGRFTREKRVERQRIQELLRQSRKLLADNMK
jgi:hypothetical protein